MENRSDEIPAGEVDETISRDSMRVLWVGAVLDEVSLGLTGKAEQACSV